MHSAGNAELGKVFDDFAADPELWVAMTTRPWRPGIQRGQRLEVSAEGGKRTPMPRGFGELTSRFDLAKPVIAAVNGVAMGGGFEIALACDLIIASDNAIFALPEPRVGLAALAGGLHRLPRQIGTEQALGVILTGRRVSAEEGQRLGFVDEVVPQAKLDGDGEALGERNLPSARRCRFASKDVVYRELSVGSLEEAMSARLGACDVARRGFHRGTEGVCQKTSAELEGSQPSLLKAPRSSAARADGSLQSAALKRGEGWRLRKGAATTQRG